MQSCIKLMQLVFNRLLKVMTYLMQVAKNKVSHSDMEKLVKYNENLYKFVKYTSTLTEEQFANNIQEISKRVNKLLEIFSIEIVKIINENGLSNDINPRLKGLPESIVQLLNSFRIYVEKENAKIDSNKYAIVKRMNEYKNAGNSLEPNKSNKTLNESNSYFFKFYSLLQEVENTTNNTNNEPGWVGNFLSGGLKTLGNAFKFLTFDSKKVGKACDKFSRGIDRLNTAANNSMRSGNTLSFFTTPEFAQALGGIVMLVAAFALIRRVFNKTVNFIKDKWSGFWSWTRGE